MRRVNYSRSPLPSFLLLAFAALCGMPPGAVRAGGEQTIAVSENSTENGKASASPSSSETQTWLLHAQATEIIQGQPGFRSPYTGPNSLPPGDHIRQTSSLDIYLGARLWPGGEIYFNPEYFQGFGFAGTHGIAAFPNAEAYKVGTTPGNVFIPHLFFRQTFGFGGEQEQITGDELDLAHKVDISRLTFTIGRLQVGDQFDNNAYSHDARTQFLNWAL